MMKRIVPGALALALTLTLAGCPGGKDPKPDSGPLAEYCARLSDTLNVEIACLHADPAIFGSLVTSCAALEAEITAGRLTYHSDRAQACFDAAGALTCDSFGVGVPACEEIFSGVVPNGSACLDDVECANGHCRFEASCPGVCTAYVGVDGDCTAPGAKCAPDLSCGQGGRCVAVPTPSPEGQPCASGGCASGLYCDPTSSKCARQRKSGSCKGADECAFGYACTEGGSCAPYAGRGEHCGPDVECGFGWVCIDGICGAAPAIGSPCASTGRYVQCGVDAHCDTSGTSSICRARKPGGATCTDLTECQSLACTAGRCEFETCIQ